MENRTGLCKSQATENSDAKRKPSQMLNENLYSNRLNYQYFEDDYGVEEVELTNLHLL